MLQGFFQITLTLLFVIGLTPIVGRYLAQVFLMEKTWLDAAINPLERLIYLLGDIEPQETMSGRMRSLF